MSAAPAKTVLLVEDNDDNRTIYETVLLHSGYGVIHAADGAEGVRLAREQRPDLILMDMGLPVLDGWEATRRIKADPDTRSIPIVALTAHALQEARDRCMAAGCDGYLAKPLVPRDLVVAVRERIGPA